MRAKIVTSILIALGAVYASFLIIVLCLNLAPVQRFAMKTIEPILPWTLSWDKLSVEAIGGALKIEGLKAQGKDGRLSVEVDHVTTKLRLWHLLHGKLVLSPLVASHCTIRQLPLLEPKKADLQAAGKKFQELASSFLLSRLAIHEGTIGPFSFELAGHYSYSFDEARFSIDASLLKSSHSDATITHFLLALPNGGKLHGGELHFSGSLDPAIYLSTSDDVFLKGLLGLRDAAWGDMPLGNLDVDASLSHESFKLNRFESALSDGGTLSLTGTLEGLNLPASPFTAQATYKNDASLVYPIELKIAGDIGAKQVVIKDGTVTSGPATLSTQGTLQRLKGALDLKVSLQGLDTRLLFPKFPDGFIKSFGIVAAGEGTIRGTFKDPQIEMAAAVTDAQYLIFQASDGKGTVTYSHRKLHFDSLGETALTKPLQVSGTINFAANPQRIETLSIEAEGHPLEKAIPSWKQNGTVSGRLVLHGPTNHVEGEGNLTATDLHFGPAAADTVSAQMKLSPDRFVLSEIMAEPPLLGRKDGVGNLDIGFKSKEVLALKGRPAPGVDFAASYSKTSQIFKLELLKIESPYGVLGAHGEIRSGGALNLDARGALDLSDLAGFPSLFRDGEGSAELNLKVRGTMAEPIVAGDIDLHGTTLTLAQWDTTLGPLSGKMRLAPTSTLFNDVNLGINDGRIVANGSIGSVNFRPQSLQLKITVANFPWARDEEFRLLFDGDFNIAGPINSPFVSGHASITEGRYYREFKITELLLKPLQHEAAKEGNPLAPYGATRLNVAIDQTGDLNVKNNFADIALKTDLRLTGTLAHPSLGGSLQTIEGKIFYLGSTFNILSGRIDFTDPAKINPEVEIRAEKILADAKGPIRSLEIVFKGPLDNLQLVLPPNVDRRDFFNLLAFGHTEDELKRAGIDRGSFVAGGLALGELSRNFEGPLGKYTSLDVVRLGAADVTRRDAISQLTLGKNVSDRLLLEFLTEIAPQDAQKTVGATYFLTDNIQLKGVRTGSPRAGSIYQVNLSLEFEYR